MNKGQLVLRLDFADGKKKNPKLRNLKLRNSSQALKSCVLVLLMGRATMMKANYRRKHFM